MLWLGRWLSHSQLPFALCISHARPSIIMTLHQIISLSLVDPKKTSSVIVLVMVTWLVYHVLFQLVSHVFCFFGSSSSRLSLCAKIFPRPHMLGCTNAAKRPPHSRPTRRRRCLRVSAASSFFFFVSRLAQTRADLHRLRLYRSVSGETADSGRNSKKSAKRTV